MFYSRPAGRFHRRFWRLEALHLAMLLITLWPSALVLALPDDRDQPMRISADTALRDEKQGVTEYSGNVHMIQGSLEIEADKLTIYHQTEQADKIIARGRPAKLQQQPTVDKPLVRAHADIIEYYKSDERVHLKNNARIAQDGATVTGDSIEYLIVEQLVKADSNLTREGKRVEVVIPPQTLRREEDASGATDSE